VLDPISDSVTWLARTGHDDLGLSWRWALVMIGAGARALRLPIQDAINAGNRRILAVGEYAYLAGLSMPAHLVSFAFRGIDVPTT
jgi:hypothetical protein